MYLYRYINSVETRRGHRRRRAIALLRHVLPTKKMCVFGGSRQNHATGVPRLQENATP